VPADPQDVINKAIAAFQMGSPSSALQLLRQAHRDAPDPLLRWYEGVIVAADSPADARPLFEELVASEPHSGLYRLELGRVLVAVGEHDLAAETVEGLDLSDLPFDARTWRAAGVLSWALGRRDEAIDLLRCGLAEVGREPLILGALSLRLAWLDELDEAGALARETLAQVADDEATGALVLVHRGTDDAQAALDLLTATPLPGPYWARQQAEALLSLERPDEALALVEDHLEDASLGLLSVAMRAALRAGKTRRAADLASRRLLEGKPRRVHVDLLGESGDGAALHLALELGAPVDACVRAVDRWVAIDGGPSAGDAARLVAEHFPGDVSAQQAWLDAAQAAGDGPAVAQAAQRLVDLQPDSGRAWGLLGMALGATGRVQEARVALRQALQHPPVNDAVAALAARLGIEAE